MEFENVDDDFEVAEGGEADEAEATIDIETLIAIVKANPPLYSKRNKGYSGENFNKQLAWSHVGACLVPPVDGKLFLFAVMSICPWKYLRKHRHLRLWYSCFPCLLGSVAEKTSYNLRQRFNKELKKVRVFKPSGSGADCLRRPGSQRPD